jgi:hypothetical protein
MKQPAEANFDVKLKDGGVEVTFKPTRSHYSFTFLADPKDIARLGPLSPDYHVRHGTSGDTGEYVSQEVFEMARRLASAAARSR